MIDNRQISEEQPSDLGGCSSCFRNDIATPYKTPGGAPECAACYRKRKRRERGLKPPGPKPIPGSVSHKKLSPAEKEARRLERQETSKQIFSPDNNGGRGRRRLANEETCANGHRWEEAGFYLRADPRYPGGYQKACRLCQRHAFQKSKGRAITPDTVPVGPKNKDKTACPQGHEYAIWAWFKADGSRQCRKCLRDRRIKELYNLTPEAWDEMLIAQSGRCGVCLDPMMDPHVDHNHATGAVRELLCVNCNNGLGRFLDSPARLRAAALYLEKHGCLD